MEELRDVYTSKTRYRNVRGVALCSIADDVSGRAENLFKVIRQVENDFQGAQRTSDMH